MTSPINTLTDNDLNTLKEWSNMIAPQSVNTSDAVMTFDGVDIITEADFGVSGGRYQKELGRELGYTSISVDVVLLDMTANTEHTKSRVTMSYRPAVDCWTILISDITADNSGSPMLVDGHKYFGVLKQSTADPNPTPPEMRLVSVYEFSVDNGAFEDTLMNLGYELDFVSSPPKMVWRDAANNIIYKADVYSGGSGTSPATSPADITHRGPVVKA